MSKEMWNNGMERLRRLRGTLLYNRNMTEDLVNIAASIKAYAGYRYGNIRRDELDARLVDYKSEIVHNINNQVVYIVIMGLSDSGDIVWDSGCLLCLQRSGNKACVIEKCDISTNGMYKYIVKDLVKKYLREVDSIVYLREEIYKDERMYR